jgi:hypothetical protein
LKSAEESEKPSERASTASGVPILRSPNMAR